MKKRLRTSLSDRFLISLGIILLIRIGTFLPVPGISQSDVEFYMQRHSIAKNVISTFSGDNNVVIGLFTLNILPYINANIFVQLLIRLSPQFRIFQKEGGFQSRRLISQLTRLVTLLGAVLQSIVIVSYLHQVLFDWNFALAFAIILWLTTGGIIVLWLSELITSYGLGNGTSLIIFTNIVSNLPTLVKKLSVTSVSPIYIIALILVSIYGIVFLQHAFLQIPLIPLKLLTRSRRIKRGSVKYYIPIKFNQSGVMPIIVTTSLLVVPNYIVDSGLFPWLNFLSSFKWFYWFGYFILILASSSIYSSISLDPEEISYDLQKMAVVIPGIRPGIETTYALAEIIKTTNRAGSMMLAMITILPNFIESSLNITGLSGLSTTSFLILIGVVLEIISEIKDFSYSNMYSEEYL